ncbi:hypothetical protein [Metamycoplasma buccale]|uniref:hypothetical protein n=1 Tax=Metamycoplasma buccale TaxID=55602 RepID=UPI00398F13DF
MNIIKNKLDLYKYYLGGVVFNCQIIEMDLKVIYALLNSNTKKDIEEFLEDLIMNKSTIGSVVHELIHSGLFNKKDSQTLYDIKKIRNYWCHEGVIQFAYEKNNFNRNFEESFAKLEEEHEYLTKLQSSIEKYKLNFYGKKFG